MSSSSSPCTLFLRALPWAIAMFTASIFSEAKANHHKAADNTAPGGFRSLFNGETLDGWKKMPRVPVPKYPGAPSNINPNAEWVKKARENVGKWTVVEGAIVGEGRKNGDGPSIKAYVTFKARQVCKCN